MDILEELVTPKRAQELLALNHSNRPLNRKHVQFLAQQMIEGAWLDAGDPIRISKSGRLLDGQHRLSAIVETDLPAKLLVISGLADETFQVMDTGRNRSAADIVSLTGQQNATNVAALVKMIIQHQKGKAGQEAKSRIRTGITNAEVVTFLSKGIDIQPFIRQGVNWFHECRLLTATEYSFLFWLLSPVESDQAESFLTSLAKGISLTSESPVYMLRRKLENYKLNKVKVTSRERLALTLKAWNLVRTGKTVSLLTWNAEKDSFPEPI